jgi:hypothetical protein
MRRANGNGVSQPRKEQMASWIAEDEADMQRLRAKS